MKVKNWIIVIIISAIISLPSLFFVHYSILFHKYVKWEQDSIGTNQWIPSTKYVTPKRIFFLENWELPIINKSK
jgi:hypothetical protein